VLHCQSAMTVLLIATRGETGIHKTRSPVSL
jgi:hypothetical protein